MSVRIHEPTSRIRGGCEWTPDTLRAGVSGARRRSRTFAFARSGHVGHTESLLKSRADPGMVLATPPGILELGFPCCSLSTLE